VRDITPPQLSLPPDQAFEATSGAGAVVHYLGATATDDSPPVTIEYSRPNDSLFALGRTTVHVTATDAAGNIAEGDFVVTVVDTTAPLLSVPADLTVEATSAAGAVVTFAAQATDAVSTPTVTYSKQPGSVFALGTTVVTATATDAAGNVTKKTFSVTVVDTTPPVLTVPGDMKVEATSAAGALVTFAAQATDAVSAVKIVYSKQPGSVFALGTTVVTVTATDAAGNVTTKTFNVTVVDTTPPVLTVPADMKVEATSCAGAVVTFAAQATDAVSTPTVTYSKQPGSVFALGTTVVTATATDAAGNVTTKTFKITVVDTTPPMGSIQIDCGAAKTTTGRITVTLNFRDVVGLSRMRFSTDGGVTWTAWEPYSTTKALTLTGADGVKTVIAQVADAAGNIGTASDSITLSTGRGDCDGHHQDCGCQDRHDVDGCDGRDGRRDGGGCDDRGDQHDGCDSGRHEADAHGSRSGDGGRHC
jgi:GTP:adenosylcobinamide-phosphate guanylyltransferase